MDLYHTILKVSDCCYYTDCEPHSFTGWCRSGYIKAERKPTRTSPWRIKAIDFADFLYFNKYYLGRYREKKLFGDAKELQEAVLREVDSRPPVIDADDLADLFHVKNQTIRNWVKNGILAPCGNTSSRLHVIQADDILKAFDRAPRLRIRYRTIYTALNRRKANGKPLTVTSH